MLDQLNQAVDKVGGTWAKLNRREHGIIEGDLVDFEIRPKTFEDKPVLNSKTGQQREEWVLTLRVDEDNRDPDDSNDDGIRKLSLNESAQRALAAAIKESKSSAEVGGRVKGMVAEDPPNDRAQAVYKFKYTPPAPKLTADADAIFAGAAAAASGGVPDDF